MTILVGMVGSDGILLAADQRLMQPAAREWEFDDYEGICKIVNWQEHRVAYARVGDYISKAAGDKLLAQLTAHEFDLENIEASLERVARLVRDDLDRASTRQPINVEEERALLVVFYGIGEPQLWRLRITPPDLKAQRIAGMCIRGATGNRARFFDRYFGENIPVERLKFLAGHIVLTAGLIDPVMIDGLDIAFFVGGNCKYLNGAEKQEIREQTNDLEAFIKERLVA